jgi:DNA-binding transcriptional ArsR family regulator
MLTKLFSSTVRVKILKLLVMHADKNFSATDIAGATGTVIRSVNKEITKLVEAGAVIEETKERDVNHKSVKIKHYRADAQFVIFDEIKSIFLKLQIVELDEFKNKVAKLGAINYVVLTGNFVGESKTKIDLLIVGKANRGRVEKFVSDFERRLGWELNWSLMDLAEYDYRRQIGDMFLFDIMAGKKIEVYSKFV